MFSTFNKLTFKSLTPISTISDDTDRSFWGEDELSTSESTQQLNKKQKRRHTLSYRNRIAVHRSRSSLFQSSSSSLNSVSEQISSEVHNRLASRFKIKQLKQCGFKVGKRRIWTKNETSFSTNIKRHI
nr:PREDICTED: uncharacterized protein LOC100880625 [Megachile rotundata]